MKKLRKDKVLAIVFIFIALLVNCVIVYQSCLNGAESSEVSNGVTQVLMNIINFIRPETITELNLDSFIIFIRKGLGHFGAFMVSGVFTFLAVHYSFKNLFWYQHYWGALLALALGIMLAATTELIQLSVDNRSGQFSDVLLDSMGYVVGLLIITTIVCLIKKPQSATNKSQ